MLEQELDGISKKDDANRHTTAEGEDTGDMDAERPPQPTFAALNAPSHVHGKLPNMRILKPTPIQVETLKVLNRDLTSPPPDAVLHAVTGSGKTLAYLLPIFSRIQPKEAPFAKLRAIIVTPTRELSYQVTQVAETLAATGKHKDPNRAVRVRRLVGELTEQTLYELKHNPPHIIIGTPATLSALLPARINLGELQTVVLDEADELMRNHSIASVRNIVSVAKRHKGRPGIVCVSATSSFGLQKFVTENLSKSTHFIDLTEGVMGTPDTINHLIVRPVNARGMFNTFTRMLAALRPQAVLSFHSSQASMEALEAFLRSKGIGVSVIGNSYSNAARARALERIQSGQNQVLLSTEMAARGLDIPRLSHVVNFDPPSSLREYVHRAGRVGRLSSTTPGKKGTIVSFVTSDREVAAMTAAATELGVQLSELTFEFGEPVAMPLVEAPEDIELHRQKVREKNTKLRVKRTTMSPKDTGVRKESNTQ